ncbi:MAG TPA: KH domain-containing protein [Clostridia bacterium]|nr:KH domain-containing protein [Clostridia bacterium]
MGHLVEIIAKGLVDNPEQVNVNEIEGNRSIILELKVAPEDMGKVIGKQGRIAKAIRTVVKAAATKQNKRVIVEIIQ